MPFLDRTLIHALHLLIRRKHPITSFPRHLYYTPVPSHARTAIFTQAKKYMKRFDGFML